MHAAYIAYVVYQNEPSRPVPVELEVGRLREQLMGLFGDAFPPDSGPDDEDQPGATVLEEGDEYYGDVRMYAENDNGSLVFLTFGDADRATAFGELGLDLEKLSRG